MFAGLPRIDRGRWIAIGRLDVATTGLLLLTNDGALAHRMMHPSSGLDREYAVRVDALLSDEQLAAVRAGIVDDGERLAFSDIQHYDGRGRNHWYHVVIMEEKNREVRRIFRSLGISVSRLKRVRFGPVVLPSRLTRGKTEEMAAADTAELCRLLRVPYRSAAVPAQTGTQTVIRFDRVPGRRESAELIPPALCYRSSPDVSATIHARD